MLSVPAMMIADVTPTSLEFLPEWFLFSSCHFRSWQQGVKSGVGLSTAMSVSFSSPGTETVAWMNESVPPARRTRAAPFFSAAPAGTRSAKGGKEGGPAGPPRCSSFSDSFSSCKRAVLYMGCFRGGGAPTFGLFFFGFIHVL